MERRDFLLVGAAAIAAASLPKLPFIDLGLSRRPISGGHFREGNPDGHDLGVDSAPNVDQLIVGASGNFKDGDTWEFYSPDCKPTGKKIKIIRVDAATNTLWLEAL